MNRFRSTFSVYLAIGLMFFGFVAQADAQQRARNEREVRDIIRSLNSRVDDFRYSLDGRLSRDEYEVNGYLQNLQRSISAFDEKFQRRRENADDVTQILSAAKNINDILALRRAGGKIQSDWTSIRTLLDRLASSYQLNWRWDERYRQNPNYPTNQSNQSNYPSTRTNTRTNSISAGLTGTYRLDRNRSEDTRDIVEQAIRGGARTNRDAQSDLEEKLDSPEQIAIEVRGNQITIASSKAAQITFPADGRERTENLGNGRTLRLRTTLRGQELTVASLGGDSDYTVTFASIENGRAMRVTRRITTDYLRQTVFAESIYEKIDGIARFDINGNDRADYADYNNNDDDGYSSSDNRDYRNNYPNTNPTTRTGRGNFIIPNGTMLTGILESDIDTKYSQNGDRFQLVVQSPNQYRGAIIEGTISGINRSGRVSGRSEITFNFETIRMSNGRTYDFAGYLQGVTDENGRNVRIDSEGTTRGDNQTKETLKRGGIGAGIGAIIGAIAGGGKGAAIGAIIGGSAGAGSVIVQGRDDLELRAGSTMTVQSSSPNR